MKPGADRGVSLIHENVRSFPLHGSRAARGARGRVARRSRAQRPAHHRGRLRHRQQLALQLHRRRVPAAHDGRAYREMQFQIEADADMRCVPCGPEGVSNDDDGGGRGVECVCFHRKVKRTSLALPPRDLAPSWRLTPMSADVVFSVFQRPGRRSWGWLS